MSVLIGLMDQRIHESETVTWDTNKFGGLPIWINSESSQAAPVCKNCGQILSLVSQLYCPLGGSSYHRCIYLFVCPGDCSKQEHGWRVFRSMKHDMSHNVEPSQQLSGHSDEFWLDEQDEWGEGSSEAEQAADPVSELREASCDAAAYLENAHMSQDSADDDVSQSAKSVSQLMLSDHGTEFHDSLAEHGDSRAATRSLTAAAGPVTREDSGDSEMLVVTEEVGLADAERWNAIAQILNTKLEQSSGSVIEKRASSVVFEPHYICVVDEPHDQSESFDHVTDLIRNYERSEGKQLEALIHDRPQSSRTKGDSSEVYERTELKHGDRVFYKFMKRLQRCPQQCVRYERGGKPLLVSSLQGKPVSRCPYCGGERMFELQLLPALIPYFKTQSGFPCEVEFGTVLVFTCKGNCWPAEHDPACKVDFLEESIILQQDPDIHLYR